MPTGKNIKAKDKDVTMDDMEATFKAILVASKGLDKLQIQAQNNVFDVSFTCPICGAVNHHINLDLIGKLKGKCVNCNSIIGMYFFAYQR